ncbi:hypothetical protein CFIMG_006076RAa [Ceratocystis fimbriata CBS 114723]|uniref:Uncharacterized protein n=1 Tax=Ceratocystis fimbriata CBS 114723 TaxID=1035309 RepID=A0A2C5WUX2_9PEZI|nr:hypothetical protein CFIMG_006076RAa [Ceratocystis fimbriata CBS 114723]
MALLTYTPDDILKLRPEKMEAKLLENMFKPLHDAGLWLLGATRSSELSEDGSISDSHLRKPLDSQDGPLMKSKNLFHGGRMRQSSGDSSQSYMHSHQHAHVNPQTQPPLHANTHEFRAPPTLAAQKEEGFQRFYKAVVSPTHVRVTAGGRIVPNTKPPASPTPKFAREKEINLDGQAQGRPSTGVPHNPFYPSFPSSTFAPHPLFGFPAPGMMALPFPSPYGLGVPGAMPGPIPGIMPKAKASTSSSSDQNDQQSPNGMSSAACDSTANEQPDAFRYMPQNRWMNPWGGQFSYGVPGMMPGAGYVPSPFMGAAMSPPGFYGMPGMAAAQQSTTTSRQRSGTMSAFTSDSSVLASSALKAPLNPPVSSIRPSQISKAHLDSLRTNLRRVEDQLKYNMHQIDVPLMEQRAAEIRDAIKGLEEALPSQLEFEELHYPKIETRSKIKSTASAHPSSAPLSRKESRRIRSDSHKQPLAAKGARSFKSNAMRNTSSESESNTNHSNGKLATSSSSSMAPTAPPFKPQNTEHKTSSGGSIEPVIFIDATEASEPVKKASAAPSRPVSSSSRLSTGGSSTVESLKKTVKPYLEGELLPGMDEKNAMKNGFHYRRPLTEEEVRARHLYWGRAPQSALRGLPKFDGKDFYFASPPKIRHAARSGTSTSRVWGRRSSREEDYGKKVATTSESTMAGSEVSLDASASHQSESVTLIGSCSTSHHEKSDDSTLEVKRQPLSSKTADEKTSPKMTVNWTTNGDVLASSAQALTAQKSASPAMPSDATIATEKSPEPKQATPAGARDKLRRGIENLPPSGLVPHF